MKSILGWIALFLIILIIILGVKHMDDSKCENFRLYRGDSYVLYDQVYR